VIRARVRRELPLMATEAIIMAAVRAGGDRQEIHEQIRVHSHAAIKRMKEEGAADNDLMARLANDPHFKAVRLDDLLDPARFVGLAPRQTRDFLAAHVAPVLAAGEIRAGDNVSV
jgi:adenylosuccinate lyase